MDGRKSTVSSVSPSASSSTTSRRSCAAPNHECDITYGTNSEFGFDYLRDNGMATSREQQVQRGH